MKLSEFTNQAGQEVDFFVSDKEVEIYVGGYFVTSVDIKDLSDEAKYEFYIEERKP